MDILNGLNDAQQTAVTNLEQIAEIFQSTIFSAFNEINVLPLIYDEKAQQCNILIFNYTRAKNEVAVIKREGAGHENTLAQLKTDIARIKRGEQI